MKNLLVFIPFFFAFNIVFAQCPTNGTTSLSGTIIISTNCTFSTDDVISGADIIIQDGASLTINFTGSGTSTFDQLGGSITLESVTAQMTINGDAIFEDLSLSISSGTIFTISGETTIGAFGSSASTDIALEGTFNIGSNLILNNMSSLTGSGSLNVTGSVTDNGVEHSGFDGDVSCSGGCGALPVELISFFGYKSGDTIDLTWVTASELNNEGFEIQKSFDGIHFEHIDFVAGNGTSSNKNKYFFTTEMEPGNKVYYRLKQIDFDGTHSYSQTISIKDKYEGNNSLVVYPTTVSTEIHLKSDEIRHQLFKAQVLDNSGKTHVYIDQWVTLEELENQLNQIICNLERSMYLLVISNNKEKLTYRFYKN